MPLKDKEKAKQYFKEYMAKRRKGLTVKPDLANSDVKPMLNPNLVKPVKPEAIVLNPKSENVEPEVLNPVKPREDSLVKPEEVVKPCSNCPRLQQAVDNCDKRHTIPNKDADFINLMWDKRYKKFVFYGCATSCWTGKYCNDCSSLEEKLINKINKKHEPIK